MKLDEVQAINLGLERDDWLSGLMKRDVFCLKSTSDNFSSDSHLLNEITNRVPNGSFVYLKVPANKESSCGLLEGHGFSLIETEVTFKKKIDSKSSLEGLSKVRPARFQDAGSVESLAAKSFVHSRFFRDPEIPVDLAETIKKEWAGNFFRGKRGDQLLVYEDHGSVLGFLQLIKKQDSKVVIDLIAVREDKRRLGIATDLITYIDKHNPLGTTIIVGTQESNISSICFYERLGFKVFSCNHTFHFHKKIKRCE